MKIGSKIHPKNGQSRTVTIHGAPYSFKPAKDKAGNTHFVADVKDEKHAGVLMGHEAFYPFDAKLEQVPALTRPVTTPVAAAAPAPARSTAFDAATTLEAAELLKGDASTIGAAVSKVSSLNVVRAAIVIENAAATPRADVVTLLQATLDGAKAAGVTG